MGKCLVKFFNATLKCYLLIIILAISITVVCLCFIIFFSKLPDFQHPRDGFETRGTDISDKYLAYEALLKKSLGVVDYFNKEHSRKEIVNSSNSTYLASEEEDEGFSGDEDDEDANLSEKSFFCGNPIDGHAKLIYARTDGSEEGMLEHIKSMCVLEDKLVRKGQHDFNRYCDKEVSTQGEERSCCPSWSLGNYIASFSGRPGCLNISQEDLDDFEGWTRCCGAEGKCANATRDKFHCSEKADLLKSVQEDIMDKWSRKGYRSKYILSHLPLSKGLASRGFYQSIRNEEMVEGGVKIVAMDFDLKYDVFDEFLRSELFRSAPSFIGIIIMLTLYTGSIFITLATLTNIFMSLVISFFIYHFIFQIHFFPFLNLLSVIILYATGIDAMFISHYLLSLNKDKTRHSDLSKFNHTFAECLPQAFAGFIASSAATCVAYALGGYSYVAVLRCFAVFAALSVTVHFFLYIFFIPSVIVLNQRIPCNLITDLYAAVPAFDRMTKTLHQHTTSAIIFLIHKFRIILILLFSALTLTLVILFSVYFRRFLPSSKDFKLLVSWHPFEKFDSIFTENFILEHTNTKESYNFPMRFVWGVRPVKRSKYLVAEVEGGFEREPFDLSSKQAQKFLLGFCKKVRGSKYYTRQVGVGKNNCFMEDFRALMRRGCMDINGTSLKPCCSASQFPYKKKIFKKCLSLFIPTLARSALLYSHHKTSGLRFNSNFSQITALVVEFVSSVPFDVDYERLRDFHAYMDNFTKVSMRTAASEGLQHGWFSSDLLFFDLQQNLFKGILASLTLTFCGLCFVCCFFTGLTTLSVFCVISITLSTTTSLILLLFTGWTFNVFESMAFSLVVGLTIDFTLHNAAAFQHAGLGRGSKVEEVAAMNGAVFLAGLTTFLVGVCYQGSVVMAFKQLSSLLLTVVAVSWIYSTFFFLPLLSTLDDD